MENLQENIDDENLLNAAPNLHQVSRGNNYQAPAGYFEQLPTTISEMISVENAGKPGVKSWFSKYRIGWLSGLATMAIIVFIIFKPEPVISVKQPETVAQFTVYDYLKDDLIDTFSEEELITAYLAMTANPESQLEPSGYYDDLEDYLIEEDIEIEMLINEL